MHERVKETNLLISKGMYVLLFDVVNGCYLVKKNRLISKGMSNIYYLEKPMFSKLFGKVNLLEEQMP